MGWFTRDYSLAELLLPSQTAPDAANQDLYYFYNNGCDGTGFSAERIDQLQVAHSGDIENAVSNLIKIVPGCGYPMLIHNNSEPGNGCEVVRDGDIGEPGGESPIIKDDDNRRMYIDSNYSWCIPVNEPLEGNPNSCPSR